MDNPIADAIAAEPVPLAERLALLDIIAAVQALDDPGPEADHIRVLAEHGLGDGLQPAPGPGGTIAIGPQCFASADSRVISWRGISYYPWAADPDHQVLPAPEAAEMRAVIDMIWRMCQKPKESAGLSRGLAVNGEHLADRIAGLIKNSGMEPF